MIDQNLTAVKKFKKVLRYNIVIKTVGNLKRQTLSTKQNLL
ncbi:hypothetical protein MWLp12_3003 [Lactiplantibacillus plantarum]|nr:hypothetical protein LPLWJ_32300 [Lactiplantibacillus plantarum WJL]WCL70350.1 hypothetical protein MWLp12_3003 [Lactiplantibacillus plantarum]